MKAASKLWPTSTDGFTSSKSPSLCMLNYGILRVHYPRGPSRYLPLLWASAMIPIAKSIAQQTIETLRFMARETEPEVIWELACRNWPCCTRRDIYFCQPRVACGPGQRSSEINFGIHGHQNVQPCRHCFFGCVTEGTIYFCWLGTCQWLCPGA